MLNLPQWLSTHQAQIHLPDSESFCEVLPEWRILKLCSHLPPNWCRKNLLIASIKQKHPHDNTYFLPKYSNPFLDLSNALFPRSQSHSSLLQISCPGRIHTQPWFRLTRGISIQSTNLQISGHHLRRTDKKRWLFWFRLNF